MSRALFGKLIVAQSVKIFLPWTQKSSLPCSQKPASYPFPEPQNVAVEWMALLLHIQHVRIQISALRLAIHD
jgi:hypothetical protein